uniref:SHOCT domain-containing protein n=1 Tax=Aplanochytrium stocchinoi TaxID=215587 RepID=A0A7S3PRK5_9STRA|mmetsp:Transcript_8281/g.10476  ORF Transcript_8281/g.10476 Transcript_8281/m.10476 type:complete len:120 (+) Transcript_8281:113-472(+)|eukprot:CAMPEP_0204824890 /NCGR_PEP_ID=MMETSP1346-20131115/2874_1 /ASSEMBLY_ACC=CAM_ASM_000771 /TAXON_ID=215587 /ORGANISM="Aplanochytrium stocchinoi, Strain GSBS06" /LENGTH=119 /DNA_ID=CAMNT_0051952299 /DNA_START=229 /DNA_END=588 /DNA_ORIENTATION=+
MGSIADELKKLSELKETGAITQDEFDALKAKVMADFKSGSSVPVATPVPAQMKRNGNTNMIVPVGGALVAGAAIGAVAGATVPNTNNTKEISGPTGDDSCHDFEGCCKCVLSCGTCDGC